MNLIKIGVVAILVCALVFACSPASIVSFGINGLVETRCIGGYLFVIGENSSARQVMDEFGRGVKCVSK